MAIFPSEPGLAIVVLRMMEVVGRSVGRSVGWGLTALTAQRGHIVPWMMEMMVTTGAYNMYKAPVKSSPRTPNFVHTGCPSSCQTNSVKGLKGTMYD